MTDPQHSQDAELREQMRAAVEHLWDGVDDVSPNLKAALRRAAATRPAPAP
ncbi:hypothetical protein BH93_02355 [Rhodococcoides fascians A25f]|uniref:hypothetical protein n=1 Tax=Rhodococcoides fascians TaxID=1828 RepID=UPI000AD07C62|nr:hypothetical protein [Rhodococcus fascians]QII04357.1 hypothetical protein BH93_02355 [Rhodococcus fascians A25f]